MKKFNWETFYREKEQDSRLQKHMEEAGRAIAIGSQIYHARKAHGWSQKSLAHRVKTSQPNISRLENADYENYTLKTLQKVARVLGLKLDIKFAEPEKIDAVTIKTVKSRANQIVFDFLLSQENHPENSNRSGISVSSLYTQSNDIHEMTFHPTPNNHA